MLVGPEGPEWPDALSRLEHDVYHLPAYAAVDAHGGGGRPRAFVWRDGDDELVLPLMVRDLPDGGGVDASSAYGYGGPVARAGLDAGAWRRACRALIGVLRDHGVVSCFVRLHPLLPTDLGVLAEVGVVVCHGDTATIDLRRPGDELRAALRKNHRRDIGTLRNRGYRVVVDADWSRLDDFVEMYHQTMRRVDADPYYFFGRDYFEVLRRELGERAHLLLGETDGYAVTGGIFTEAGGIAGYHLGGTRDDYLAHSPFKLVIDHARDWAQERGDHSFHLGGGLGGEGDELLRFKLGFAAERRPFHTWRIVLDESRYRELCARLRPGVDPADHRRFFPAYRAPAAPPPP